MYTLLLNLVLELAPFFCFCSLPPGPEPRASCSDSEWTCSRLSDWGCMSLLTVQTLEKILLNCLYRTSPLSSWLRPHNLSLLYMILSRVLERQWSLVFIAFLSSHHFHPAFSARLTPLFTFHLQALAVSTYYCLLMHYISSVCFYHFKFLYFHFSEVLAAGRNEKYVFHLYSESYWIIKNIRKKNLKRMLYYFIPDIPKTYDY